MQPSDFLHHLQATLADRYRIERELGRGGMAFVFLAEDLKHRRLVALKVLQPDLAHAIGPERFLKEIEIAARLTHPHILPLHDSGEADGLLYYVMPYVEDESLRDRLTREPQLPVEDVLRIVRNVADALSHAHALGVIHRDIKPENIMFQAGHAVVADFGIARAVDAAGGDRLTETGLAVGTPSYMSPEQSSGTQEVDGRADLYSLACMTYEMLGGEPPFTGPTPQAILVRHSVDPVPNLRTLRATVPARAQAAIEQALAKVPADRFTTPVQFADALDQGFASGAAGAGRRRRMARPRTLAVGALLAVGLVGGGWWISRSVGTGAVGGIESLAVLPFDDLSGEPGQEYFVAGMHDALIGELAQIGALRVISRTSTLPYRDSDKSVPEIARELDVDAVVEASVFRVGDSVRIQIQLIAALPEERHLWAQAFDRDVANVLAMHSDVAQAIAREIEIELTPHEESRLATARPVNPETYEAYLRGMFHLNQLTPAGFERGLAYLQQAVANDPADPLAYVGLALGYNVIGHGPAAPPEALERAKAAALTALRLDESLAEAHLALAQSRLLYDWDWAAGEQALRRALELNPNLGEAYRYYGWYHELMGRREEALAYLQKAEETDPLQPLRPAELAYLYLWGGRYDEAIGQARKSLDLNPEFPPGHFVLGSAYAAKGMYEEALAAHRRAGAASPDWRWGVGLTYALQGRRDEALLVARDLEADEHPHVWGLAEIYAALGENDEAMRWLEAAYETHHNWIPWIGRFNTLEPLHDDQRFQAMMRRLNLPS